MRVEIDVLMDYRLSCDDSVLLAIEAADTDGQTVLGSTLEIENAQLRRIGDDGTVGQKLCALNAGERLNLRYKARAQITRSFVALETLDASPLCDLPGDAVPALRPSRYCQSDLFTTFAAQQFGHLTGGALVQAIVNWVGAEISYVPGSSDVTTTAVETFDTRKGVCRDFAHLVCSLARAAHIPARYVSAYGARVDPQDFHAVAQVWLSGAWHLVDATRMSSAADLVVVACGRDAGDVAFMETENWADLIGQSVRVTQL